MRGWWLRINAQRFINITRVALLRVVACLYIAMHRRPFPWIAKRQIGLTRVPAAKSQLQKKDGRQKDSAAGILVAMRSGWWLSKADGHDEFCSVVAGMRGIRGGLPAFLRNIALSCGSYLCKIGCGLRFWTKLGQNWKRGEILHQCNAGDGWSRWCWQKRMYMGFYGSCVCL